MIDQKSEPGVPIRVLALQREVGQLTSLLEKNTLRLRAQEHRLREQEKRISEQQYGLTWCCLELKRLRELIHVGGSNSLNGISQERDTSPDLPSQSDRGLSTIADSPTIPLLPSQSGNSDRMSRRTDQQTNPFIYRSHHLLGPDPLTWVHEAVAEHITMTGMRPSALFLNEARLEQLGNAYGCKDTAYDDTFKLLIALACDPKLGEYEISCISTMGQTYRSQASQPT